MHNLNICALSKLHVYLQFCIRIVPVKILVFRNVFIVTHSCLRTCNLDDMYCQNMCLWCCGCDDMFFFIASFHHSLCIPCLLQCVYITKCVHHNTCCAKTCLTHLCYAVYSFTILIAVPLSAPKKCVCMIYVIIKNKSKTIEDTSAKTT